MLEVCLSMQIRLQIPKEKLHNISPWILTFTQHTQKARKSYTGRKGRKEITLIVILIFTSLDDSTTLMKREGWFLLEVTNVSARACFHILLHLCQEVK
jgi:hypothetical protein